MEFRFQHFVLMAVTLASAHSISQEREAPTHLKLDNEFFEIGISTGLLAIQDFNTEISIGASATFHASEDFFLRLNLLQANASLSTIEQNSKPFFQNSDRDYSQYDLSLGYNLFQGELYPSEGKSTLSSLYIAAGAGNLSFGGEKNFVTTLGVGYKLGLSRRFSFEINVNQYLYRSNLITQDNRSQHNTHLTTGIKYLL